MSNVLRCFVEMCCFSLLLLFPILYGLSNKWYFGRVNLMGEWDGFLHQKSFW